MLERLDQPHNRELVRIGERLAAGSAHGGTGNAAELDLSPGPQRLYERRPERIARVLSRDDRYPQRAHEPRESADQAAIRWR